LPNVFFSRPGSEKVAVGNVSSIVTAIRTVRWIWSNFGKLNLEICSKLVPKIAMTCRLTDISGNKKKLQAIQAFLGETRTL
jgi:hypothetical protein